MIGGFGKFVFSKGWLCIRLHCSIINCFKFLIARWYIVTKGNKRSWPFSFCVCLRADYQETKLTLTETFLWRFLGTLLLWGAVWISNGSPQNVFFRRVSSRKSFCLPLRQPYFMPGGWHEAKCEIVGSRSAYKRLAQGGSNHKTHWIFLLNQASWRISFTNHASRKKE